MIAADYAKALYELMGESDSPGRIRFSQVHEVLKRRGHERLLPAIYNEYRKLLLADERRARATAVTPEQERTRVLLELYHRLIRSH